MRKKILNPFSTLCFGLLIGTISRLLDIFHNKSGRNILPNGDLDSIGYTYFHLQHDS